MGFLKDYLMESGVLNEARDYSKYLKAGKPAEQDLSDDQNELYLYVSNNGDLYRRMLQPIDKNLKQKIKSGKYSSELSPQAFFNAVDAGAKMYTKEFGTKFSTQDKEVVAVQLAYEFEDENL